MVNPHRGEVELWIDGQAQVLRQSFATLAALEADCGAAGLFELFDRFETGQFSANDVLGVLYHGLRGGGWQGDRDALSRATFDQGLVDACQKAALSLKLAL